MQLHSFDWKEAQDILLKLVQALSPLAEESISYLPVWSRRFFIPPASTSSRSDYFQQHPVILLRAVQEKMAEWVEGSPESPLGVDQQDRPVPLVYQAKSLLRQVQFAIGELSHSNSLQNPKEEPVCKVLTQLKPKLDQLIETAMQPQEQPAAPPPQRHALPVPVRQEIIEKWHRFQEALPALSPVTERREELSPVMKRREESPPIQKGRSEFSHEKPIGREDKLPVKKRGEGLRDLQVEGRREEAPQELKQDPTKPVALPMAPVLFPPKRATLKPKKKRQSLWSKKEDRDSPEA
ncbi:MAG: hypothetical protein KGR16_01265 [Verrucomicrobia bacterium]|nr:hypothetical protein [Verrucomicrobiota bacterium]MDE3047076.1 hypothetical protein [Verrucomicrobiota bacterium]